MYTFIPRISCVIVELFSKVAVYNNIFILKAIDKAIHVVHEDMNKKLQNIQEVTNFLGSIPNFSKKIESISSTLGE